MPITPTTANGSNYEATASKSLVATLTLPLTSTGSSREIELTFPAPVTGADVVLSRGTASRALLPAATGAGGVSDSTTFPTRHIDAAATTSNGRVTVSITISAASMPATDTWELRLSATAVGKLTLSTTGTVPRIMCDPAGGFTIAPQPGFAAGHAVEQSQLTLTAGPPSAAGAPTVVGTPAPGVFHRWTSTGPVTIAGLPACGTTGVQTLTTPAVAAAQTATIVKDVWYEGSCPSNVGRLNTTTTQPLVIEPRPTVQIAVHSTVGVDTWVRA